MNYYIDPLSDSPLELGTLLYPYKTAEAVITEIINFHSHSSSAVIVYTKDVYIEDGIQLYMNFSSITFTSHPELLSANKRAELVLATFQQQDINTNSDQFHLLSR